MLSSFKNGLAKKYCLYVLDMYS